MPDSADVAPEAPTPRRMLLRGMLGRCPLCGSAGLFSRFLFLRECCPSCGHRFERRPEDAFFLGAYMINIAVGLTLLAGAIMAYGLSQADLLPGGLLEWGALTAFFAGVFPLLSYPFSKTTWAAIDLMMRPLEPAEQAEAIARAAPGGGAAPPRAA